MKYDDGIPEIPAEAFDEDAMIEFHRRRTESDELGAGCQRKIHRRKTFSVMLLDPPTKFTSARQAQAETGICRNVISYSMRTGERTPQGKRFIRIQGDAA